MKNRLYVIILWLASSLLANAATTYYVATNGVDDAVEGRGLSWDLPYLTISNAVKKATTVNDLVLASNGTYLLSDQITVSSQITVRSWNNGAADSTNTIVDGNAGTRCFNISHTGAVVEGFTVYNGNGSGTHGGGVYMTKGTLRNCIVVSNSAPESDGGGVYFSGASTGTGMVDNCLIAYNFATNGGGIGCYRSTAGALITNCVIRNNQATARAHFTGGGGVYMYTPSGTILANCSVSWNSTPFQGGGIFVMMGSATIQNCVISNNFAHMNASSTSGGGMSLAYATTLVTNCVIITNVCNSTGGGIAVEGGYCSIANCRVIGNRSTNSVGGEMAGGVDLRGTATPCPILNSVISGNSTLGNAGGVYLDQIGVIRNCLISENSAVGTGGGINIRYAPNKPILSLENCTIVSNTANVGGGVRFGSDAYIGTNFLVNCILLFNTAPSGGSNYWKAGGAEDILSCSNCCLSPALSGADINYSSDNITFDPQFVERATGNYRLDRNSPCVNVGAYRDWMINAVDLDGHRRVDKFSDIVDMGAYEYMPKGVIFFFH